MCFRHKTSNFLHRNALPTPPLGGFNQIAKIRTVAANEATHAVMKGKSGLPGTKRRDTVHASVGKFSLLFKSTLTERAVQYAGDMSKTFVGADADLLPLKVRQGVTKHALLAVLLNCRQAKYYTATAVNVAAADAASGVVHAFRVKATSSRPQWAGSANFKPDEIYRRTSWGRCEFNSATVTAR